MRKPHKNLGKIWNYFELAGQVAFSKKDKRNFFLGALGIRGRDQKIVVSFNGKPVEQHRWSHAESRLCRKLTPNSVVYVCRILRKNGEFAMAKPCPDCMQTLRNAGVVKVYYTIDAQEYGVINL